MRVLLVEDHAKLATTVAKGLRRMGMAVDVAFEGEDALGHLGTPTTTWSSSTAICPACMATTCAGRSWPTDARAGCSC